MKMLGYSAMGVGRFDAHLGDVFYATAKERGIQVVEAGPNQPAGVLPYIIKNINGVKIGIISFGSKEASSLANEKSLNILKARFVAFREARKASDILIMLDEDGVATDDWLQRNIQRLGSPDVVIGSSVHGQSSVGRKVGTTVIAPIVLQARNMGVISIYAGDKSNIRIETSSIELGEKYADDQQVADFVAKPVQSQASATKPTPAPPPGTLPPPPPPPAGAQK